MDTPAITVETITWSDLDRRVVELQWDRWEVSAETTEIDGITAGYMAGKLDAGSLFVAYHFINVIPDSES